MKEHRCLEACQVIDEISGLVITFMLWNFEMLEKKRMYYLGIKRWVIIEPILQYRGEVANCFDLLVQLFMLPLDFGIPEGGGLQSLRGLLAWS